MRIKSRIKKGVKERWIIRFLTFKLLSVFNPQPSEQNYWKKKNINKIKKAHQKER